MSEELGGNRGAGAQKTRTGWSMAIVNSDKHTPARPALESLFPVKFERLLWVTRSCGGWAQITAALAILRTVCLVIIRREETLAEFTADMSEQKTWAVLFVPKDKMHPN